MEFLSVQVVRGKFSGTQPFLLVLLTEWFQHHSQHDDARQVWCELVLLGTSIARSLMWCDAIRDFSWRNWQLLILMCLKMFEFFQKRGYTATTGAESNGLKIHLERNFGSAFVGPFCLRSFHFFAFPAGLFAAQSAVLQVLKMFMSCLPTLFMAIIHNFLTLKACLGRWGKICDIPTLSDSANTNGIHVFVEMF